MAKHRGIDISCYNSELNLSSKNILIWDLNPQHLRHSLTAELGCKRPRESSIYVHETLPSAVVAASDVPGQCYTYSIA